MAVGRASAPRPVVLDPDDDARAAARRVLAFHLACFEHEVGPARAGDVEAVHQLRVATRRARATFQLFLPVLPAATVAHLTEGLGWLGRAIGGVRDLDVLSLAVAAQGRRLDDATRAALGPLEQAIAERRAAALAELGRTLDTVRARRLLARLRDVTASRTGLRAAVRLGDVAGDLLRPLLRSVQRAGRDLDADTPPVALHRLRVRIKRLRYGCETLAALAAGAIRPLVKRLVRLQDALGEHQDAVTQAAWLRHQAASARLPPETVLAMGAIVDRLERRAAKLRRRVVKLWTRADRRRLRVGVLEALRRLRAVAPRRVRS